MPTLVCFHAHPDDEAIATGGLMALTKQMGGRVVLVVATRGERGEPQPGVLAEGEALWERRIPETFAAAEILGVDRVEFLGYVDSGMMGEPSNDFPYSFWQAEIDRAARRLAAILTEERPEVLTVYDDHGGYGHPDHIQVHRVGLRAAEIAGVPTVLQATMNRDQIRQRAAEFADAAATAEAEAEAQSDGVDAPEDIEDIGKPESELTHCLDVSEFVGLKRKAMAAHASQISDDSWFFQLPEEMFNFAFGQEWFIETGAPRGRDEPFRTSVW
jgi:LmbE family N-acetylglucosaminyl deacetylase